MYDLHGCEREPFPETTSDGAEPTENTYLERVTLPECQEAVTLLANECGEEPGCFAPKPIHMRWSESESIAIAWLECEANHPDAVPFWKDAR